MWRVPYERTVNRNLHLEINYIRRLSENKAHSIVSLGDVCSETTVWSSAWVGQRRELCLHHEWVNGSLHVRNSLKQHNEVEFPQIKGCTTYTPFAYCRHCKLIQCVHLWDDEQEEVYVVEKNRNFFLVSYCVLCTRRVLTDQWAVMAEML